MNESVSIIYDPNDIPDFDGYFVTDEFKDYAAAIELIIHSAKRPLCTRQIHNRLGKRRTRREWTLDALESLRSVELIPGLIVDRWRVAVNTRPVHVDRWNGDNMSWLFGRPGLGRKNNYADLGVSAART